MTTMHLLVAGLLLILVATSILAQREGATAVEQAFTPERQAATPAPGTHSTGVLGHGDALRNLIF